MRCLALSLALSSTPGLLGAKAELPELSVPHCSVGWASTQGYYVTNVEDLQPATWDAVTRVCWDESGITVATNNTDHNIWQTCEACGCANFNHGDVAEAFLGPVSTPGAVPAWYYELDVGAVAGAFWGAIVHNAQGSDSVYPSSIPCSAEPSPGGFASCVLDCGGPLPVVAVAQGEGWWARTMSLPWTMFAAEYTPAGNGGQPWPHWRGNFYRYSYPKKLPDGTYSRSGGSYELSGWSSTHNPSFHVPARFGTLAFTSVGLKV